VIARLWTGRTSGDGAEAYERAFRAETVGELRGVDGFRGGYLLRRALPDGGVEFTAVTLFDSLGAVRAFAGDDYETAVISAAALEVLERHDPTSTHHEVVLTLGDPPA
jgi:heme-degrading monooxygenase HmoA